MRAFNEIKKNSIIKGLKFNVLDIFEVEMRYFENFKFKM